MINAWNSLLGRLAQKAWRAWPRLGPHLAAALLWLSAGGYVVTVHGPKMARNWRDVTFLLCATGRYGAWFTDFIAGQTTAFGFLDIGANQGLYALVAARNPNATAIFAIEPVPATFALLEKNIALNAPAINAENLAIAAQNGPLAIRVPQTHSGAAGQGATGEPVTVPARNRLYFDELAKRLPDRVVAKIDVEGAEAVVVTELLASLLAGRLSHLFVEVREAPRGDTAAPVTALMTRAGFTQAHRHGKKPVHDLMFSRDLAGLEPGPPGP